MKRLIGVPVPFMAVWSYEMARFKQISQIQALMAKKECIRNIGIIAHIDHGKTTLADSLLSGAGLLSPCMAGTARVLDYLEAEQKRKITIKTANITLLYKTQSGSYLINLVDTPGHVDFTGKTTRALRIIDGAVVIVDAVEELMAQTESLTRQAIEERVRPVLFINKIDRLVTELQLNAEAIQKKLDHIINSFNDLIEIYAEAAYKNQWKISLAKGNVAFGAALYGWGFTANMAKKRALKFSEVISACKNARSDKLVAALPVYEAVLEMAIHNVPNPREAQNYRIQKIWGGNINSPIGEALTGCYDETPAIIAVSNVFDESGATIVAGRTFSGRIRKGDKLQLVNTSSDVEVKAVYVDMGAMREEIDEVLAGNLVALALSGKVEIGETLVELGRKNDMKPFECVNYISEPVVTLAIEPKNPQDMETLQSELVQLATEDPSLKASVDKDTGEYLLSGMGELHLEIAVNKLKEKRGIEITVSAPRVVYRECVQKQGLVVLSMSPNKQSNVQVQVEPKLEENIVYQGIKLAFDEYQNILLDVENKTQQLPKESIEAIKRGFAYACTAGPLCGEPIHQLKVSLITFEQNPNIDNTEIEHAVSKAIFGSFLTANPILQEPVYKIILFVASNLVGESIRLINRRRGKVNHFEQKGLFTQIEGYIPVVETFVFAKELRSATSGKAVWQSIFDHWEKLPPKLAQDIICEIRKRKGFLVEIPKPERFVET
ncbi:MAG: GTP-binding protein [Nitrososphaerota archaeon]|nr:GTP-binding protein [Nitrososphaerota archaeon]